MPFRGRHWPLAVSAATALAASSCGIAGNEPERAPAQVLTVGGSDRFAGDAEPADDPSSIEFESDQGDQSSGMARIRSEALREAARRLGSQKGYARRAWEINRLLERRGGDLSSAYDFNRVALSPPDVPGYVLPPVVSRTFDAYALDAGSRSASHSEEYFEVVKAAHLSPVVPTWRDYLVFHAKQASEVPRSLMPRGDRETSQFRGWLKEGWDAGLKQADEEFAKRAARLRRDYEGMLEYRRLVALGMMSPALVESEFLGTTGDIGSMGIRARKARIVGDADFNFDQDLWNGADGKR